MSLPDKVETNIPGENELDNSCGPDFGEIYDLLSADPNQDGQPQPKLGPSTSPYLETTSITSKMEREFLGGAALPVSPDLEAKYKEWRAVLDNNKLPADLKEIDAFFENFQPIMEKIRDQQAPQWVKIKELISSGARDQKPVLIESMKESQFLGMGEAHIFLQSMAKNPHRALGAEIMPDLKNEGGATDLAIEMPKVLQPLFDQFNSDGKKGDLEIHKAIIGPDGKEDTREDAKLALQFLAGIKEQHPDLIKIWVAARNAGIKVHCVDNIGPAMKDFDPKNPRLAKIMASREEDIKNNVIELLDRPVEEGQPKPKVIGWFGAHHFYDRRDQSPHKVAGELIKAELAKREQKMTTFVDQIGNGLHANDTNLFMVTEQIKRSLAIATHDRNGKENVLATLRCDRENPPKDELFGPEFSFSAKYGGFDNVLIYKKIKE